MSHAPLPVDGGLLARFRAAGARIQWRDAPATPRGRARGSTARIAHLNDEESRVETREVGEAVTIVVDSGPVGALVLLLEVDRRGPATSLEAVAAGGRPRFDQGAIEARWGPSRSPGAGGPSIADLVELARYALA